MQMNGNTILITGGGTGIGRGLAEAFLAEGNKVIISGRRQELLDETTRANPGMRSAALDIEDSSGIQNFAERIRRDHPSLNVVIHNAGIMRTEVLHEGKLDDAEAMVATNLLGPIRLTAALLPMLLAQERAAILTVTSGLAFVPLSLNPTYCATKAAIHSYTQSLRYQLRGTSVEVIEIIPPYVRTGLTGQRQASDPTAMPLNDFLAETMNILRTSPEAPEIFVERVKPLRYAAETGDYEAFYNKFNETLVAARAGVKQ